MSNLIGQTIGPWTVIAKRERHETKSGRRAVYVCQDRDGRVKGLRGYRLNALIAEAKYGGLARPAPTTTNTTTDPRPPRTKETHK